MRAEVSGQVGSRTGARICELPYGPGSVCCPESSSMFLESSRLPGKVCSPLGTLCPQV